MPDITIFWDNAAGRGVWQISGAQLASGNDLCSSILLCLFTNARAPSDWKPPAPSNNADPQGWWGFAYMGFEFGSLLWTYARAIRNNATLKGMEKTALTALQPLVNCGAVASFTVNATFWNKNGVKLKVSANKPTGTPETFNFDWIWAQVG